MAATSLLALIDDIATLLDDVAVLSKVAAKKAAGVLGDDLALNAEQVSGVRPDRELPVVWAVAKGSAVNKLILVPAALAISAVAPWLVIPLLMLGGAFLCFEGFHKIAGRWLHPEEKSPQRRAEKLHRIADPMADPVKFERKKIKGAIRTDFILSAEIVVIVLGIVAEAEFATRVLVLCTMAAGMTIGVYGLVAGIVKIDDAGLMLSRKPGQFAQFIGRALLRFAPWFMRALSIVGTAAMFIVGGGILVHGFPVLHHMVESLTPAGPGVMQAVAGALTPTLFNVAVGLVAGGMLTLAGLGAAKIFPKLRH